ncbi:MAG: metal-sensing transcriptional repressor [Eubacterium sp.]|nr:metal-sensing transcriptional repressor [Eubacterium sp.]
MSETKPCCTERTKVRSEKEYKDLMNRLSRIEGQVRGVKKMLESDTYCIDILTQMSAISSAVASFNNKLLENHIRSCVIHDIKDGNDEVIDELVTVLQKLMKN